MHQSTIHLRVFVVSLSPGGLGDGVSLSLVTVLVSDVVDKDGLAGLIGVAVGAADDNNLVGLVLLIQDFLHLTFLAADDAVRGFITVKKYIGLRYRLTRSRKFYDKKKTM